MKLKFKLALIAILSVVFAPNIVFAEVIFDNSRTGTQYSLNSQGTYIEVFKSATSTDITEANTAYALTPLIDVSTVEKIRIKYISGYIPNLITINATIASCNFGSHFGGSETLISNNIYEYTRYGDPCEGNLRNVLISYSFWNNNIFLDGSIFNDGNTWLTTSTTTSLYAQGSPAYQLCDSGGCNQEFQSSSQYIKITSPLDGDTITGTTTTLTVDYTNELGETQINVCIFTRPPTLGEQCDIASYSASTSEGDNTFTLPISGTSTVIAKVAWGFRTIGERGTEGVLYKDFDAIAIGFGGIPPTIKIKQGSDTTRSSTTTNEYELSCGWSDIGCYLSNIVTRLFASSTTHQDKIDEIQNNILYLFPLGYVTDFFVQMSTTTTLQIYAIDTTIPMNAGLPCGGCPLQLPIIGVLDDLINATSSEFISKNASSTETWGTIVGGYFDLILTVAIIIYILNRILGTGLMPNWVTNDQMYDGINQRINKRRGLIGLNRRKRI